MYEYLASFWNSKDVKRIKEARLSKTKHKFKDDKEFFEDIQNGNFKENNKLLDAISKIRKAEIEKDNLKRQGKGIMPKKPISFDT